MYEQVRYRDRNVVRDEEMRNSKGSTDDKLRYLKKSKSTLHSLRNLNSKRREGIVGILE